MSLGSWANAKYRKLNYIDFGFIKLSCVFFGLMLAAAWIPFVTLDWYWYALVFVLLAIKPVMKIFKK